MKFLVDRMLGSLATWLRILGFDAAYFSEAFSRKINYQSLKEGRIILTRNHRVSLRRSYDVLFITGNSLKTQLKQVITTYNLSIQKKKLFSRCSFCNVPIKPVEKSAVKKTVPAYVYKTTKQFFFCTTCKRVYWQGTHDALLFEQLKKMEISVKNE